MSRPAPFALRSLLSDCGYTDAHLKEDFHVDNVTVPLVGFATKPWDFDSACIAVVDSNGESETAAQSCRALGAPIVWVQHNGTVEWWTQHGTKPTHFATHSIPDFATFVRERRSQLDPLSVYRGKTLARVDKSRQLDFVDVGYLPLLREEAGRKLHDTVESMIKVTLDTLHEPNPTKSVLQDVFASTFRLLAGKILRDKNISGFSQLDLTKPSAVLRAVTRHYDAKNKMAAPASGYAALEPAAQLLAASGSFAVVSPESLAYVYEHTLVTKELRKKLGIHATPPWLVDYMVWQLYDWIRDIPVDERHVFEPAAGHSPFLLSTMRLLRLELSDRSDLDVHNYLKLHIHGIEVDEFAREIARLSLTLADVPNSDGWDLKLQDMYGSDVLRREARESRILFSNPPYEGFSQADVNRYRRSGQPVKHKKAVELLNRTLRSLQPGAVFGVVVPQTVISGPEAKGLRRALLEQFELREVCLFPGKVFEFAEIETAIILGRRLRNKPVRETRVRLRVVGEQGMQAFRERYAASDETTVLQRRLLRNPDVALKVPALDEVWQSLSRNLRVRDVALVGRGIEYKGKTDRAGIPVVLEKPRQNYPLGYAGVSRDQTIFNPPPERGIASRTEVIANPRQGGQTGKAQILINMGRTSRSPWRIKAMLDLEGRPFKNNFAVVRPTRNGDFATYLWAVLNSPIASAFVACRTMRKHNYEGILGEIPLPRASAAAITRVVEAARVYRSYAQKRAQMLATIDSATKHVTSLFSSPHAMPDTPTDSEVREKLLQLDAEVVRLYGLPARLERRLLDYFNGHNRRGVACTFGN
jgi:hypothetical protein